MLDQLSNRDRGAKYECACHTPVQQFNHNRTPDSQTDHLKIFVTISFRTLSSDENHKPKRSSECFMLTVVSCIHPQMSQLALHDYHVETTTLLFSHTSSKEPADQVFIHQIDALKFWVFKLLLSWSIVVGKGKDEEKSNEFKVCTHQVSVCHFVCPDAPKPFHNVTHENGLLGSSLHLECPLKFAHTRITWHNADGSEIDEPHDDIWAIDSVDPSHAGLYFCLSTHLLLDKARSRFATARALFAIHVFNSECCRWVL